MMTFSKDKALSVLQRKEVLFTDKLNPVEIIPYLSLTDMSKQEIKCEQVNYGEKRATSLLLKRIYQQDKCLVEFIKALRALSQNGLADLLDPCHIITDTGQDSDTNPKTHTDQSVTQKSTGHYHGNTPIRQLPCVVMDHLQKLDYDEKWRDLAGHLGYTIDDVQKLQLTSKSCTKQIIESWYDATIDDLFKALHAVGRLDIITELEKSIGYKSIFSGEPFIDIQENQSKKQDGFHSKITTKLDDDGKKTEDRELINSRNQTDEIQKLYFNSSQDSFSKQEMTPSVCKVSDTRTEPVSQENNALQSICDQGNLNGQNETDNNNILKSAEDAGKKSCVSNSNTEDAGKPDCVSNSNIVFEEKTMKDKVLGMDQRLIGAAAVSVFAAGLFFVFNKGS